MVCSFVYWFLICGYGSWFHGPLSVVSRWLMLVLLVSERLLLQREEEVMENGY